MVVQKTNTKKSEVVSRLTESIRNSTGIYIADFTGITVGTVTTLRANLRVKGIGMRVAKNTLIRRALEAAGIKGLEKHLVGPSALITADDQDPTAPAKMLTAFHKDNENILPLKAIYIDGQQYSGSRVSELAKMPGKRELQAQVITLALGPGAQVIGLIKGPGAKIAGQVKALVEKLEGGPQ
jgi:large subunit ribosomal protein L10